MKMGEFNLGYREVSAGDTSEQPWKDISLNTGGMQSTLQDIKVAERANGFSYRDSGKSHLRNRFIYWHISHDVLELTELSLDLNLSANKIRCRFADAPILDGVSIHETDSELIILVPTVCSVHRLVFPHPNTFYRQNELLGLHVDVSAPSIFAKVALSSASDISSFYVFNNPNASNSQIPHAAASTLAGRDGEALFVFSYPSGESLLVRQSPTGRNSSVELKHERIVPRFLYGITERLRGKASDSNTVVSMLLHTTPEDTYLLALCYEGQLKVWSLAKGQCFAVVDIMSEDADSRSRLTEGGHNYMLKKFSSSDSDDFLMVAFLTFGAESQFHIFQPSLAGSQFALNKINVLCSPGCYKDLVDFGLSDSRIWSLWRSDGRETTAYTAGLGGDGLHWIPVNMEPELDAFYQPDTTDSDPRQLYLQHVFHPGRFPLQIINKALSIYTRSSVVGDFKLSVSLLRERICAAVETEITNKLQKAEVSDEDYLDAANWCWSRFYSCCVQYYAAGLRPLGLLPLPSTGGAVLLKKSTFTLLRPMDTLEHMMLCPDYTTGHMLSEQQQLAADFDEATDVMRLMMAIAYLEEQMSDSFKQTFEKQMAQLESPDVLIAELMMEILVEMDEQFSWTIVQKLNACTDIYRALHKVLELLRLDVPYPVASEYPKLEKSGSNVFSSLQGTRFVVECLRQQAAIRFAVCRNLLIVQNILLERNQHDSNVLESIRSVCTPEIVVLTQASYSLLFVCGLVALPVVNLEPMAYCLKPLELAPVFNAKPNSQQPTGLMELFLLSTGGSVAHKSFGQLQLSDDDLVQWHVGLLGYINHVAALIWPISGNPVFAEWLLASGQHLWLQQYVRILNNWCEWSNCTRNFFLATALLSTGEHHKALSLFVKAAEGVHSDQFLMKQIASSGETDKSGAFVACCLKVAQLFELHGGRDFAIKIAEAALSMADKNSPHVATLHSIKFVHHLALAHYEQAYDSLNSNPDIERKRDNLRDLVKTLLDNRELDVLMSFPFTGMQQLFISILFARARATDTVDNIFYEFLYSYQIKRGDEYFRLAAAVMYEYGFRLLQHNSLQALEKQVKCYLAALNTLKLCDANYSWVLKPAPPDADSEVVTILPLAKDGTEEMYRFVLKQQVEGLGVGEVKKELEIATAKLRLGRFDPHTLTASYSDAAELIALLASTGLFKSAFQLCSTLDLPYDSVFDALTRQCVLLSYSEDTEAWHWLMENDLSELPYTANTPSAIAWILLQTFLEQYEEDKFTHLHKVVCKRLLDMGFRLPVWILASYKLRNSSELLRLYLSEGYLDEAIELAHDLLLGAMGHGKEHFGFQQGITTLSPPFCLPVNTIDTLLHQLELQYEHNGDEELLKAQKGLESVFVNYLETSARLSNEMCRQKLSNVF